MSLLSYENQESSSKLLQFLNGNGYLQKKIRQMKKIRSAYVSASTKVIIKLTEHIHSNSDMDCIKLYEIALQNAIKIIRDITTKLHNVVKDKKETQNLLNFCTVQEFRVLKIRKSLNKHTHSVTIGTLDKNLNKSKVTKSSHTHKMHSKHSVHPIKSSPIPSQFDIV